MKISKAAGKPLGTFGPASAVRRIDPETGEVLGEIDTKSKRGRRFPPSKEQIEMERTPAGGWTRATLARWGVPWPPPKGWKKELLKRRAAFEQSRRARWGRGKQK